ncbi:DUF2795 domain-containing protein [Rhodococcus pyridinivorans]|uniref:DUF2795 domain-containing protein n=1 Tax=Rhodococcus pyridinivorans TaxID=103816 RepID=UPI0020785229|nr:DUF2795 domain-containing protein [Rhodococcus pyridinivorans]USI90173.1 DUF2795 domain-containing protein [Rhodococcus pyridinivorans]
MSAIHPIELQRGLAGVYYPCECEGVVRVARDNGAAGEVVAALEKLPDTHFDGSDDLSKTVF